MKNVEKIIEVLKGIGVSKETTLEILFILMHDKNIDIDELLQDKLSIDEWIRLQSYYTGT